ncbi:LutC/YkgG family protein [Halobacillus karajensis]|uniref:Lactate utilization protein C n=1 Tax=Halobacillus karajensis TaxID=195088 RepID=A0A059NYX1_9BACI|nr:lactate utilization protein C [Halobacillus karajensis]CDQ18462.1 Lactate utilization protein C [Halobacillus karajensis]CDQ23466.1 Lactate utilization protein C [Halobacillus karajensis]CDQ26948.1 Lactate utilization protein C [Halobacillus karajensis]
MAQGTVQNRESFLNNIAEKLGREQRRSGVEHPTYTKQPQWDIMVDYTTEQLVDVLKEQCTAIHTDVKEATIDELPAVIDDVMKEYGAEKAAVWDDLRFAEFGLTSFMERPDINIWGSAPDEDDIKITEQADVGITFSDYTLAESGTVVLMNGGGKGQSVSLLPTYYIALIPLSTIVPRMSQVTRKIHEEVQAGRRTPSCINFISGPSNSADIELNLVVGVHGPVKASYILIDDL